MINRVLGVLYGLALALPLAVVAGVLPQAASKDFAGAGAMLAMCALLALWPYLSALCMQKRQSQDWGDFRQRLLAGLLILPAAAVAMLKLVDVGGGFGAAVIEDLLHLLGAGMILLGALAAALAYFLDAPQRGFRAPEA